MPWHDKQLMPPDLECMNNAMNLILETAIYLVNQNRSDQSFSIEINKAITALRKTELLISKWKFFILKNNCLSLLARDIEANIIDIIEFKSLFGDFQRNLSEFEIATVLEKLDNLRMSSKTLGLFILSLFHLNRPGYIGFTVLPEELSNYIKVGEIMKDASEIRAIKDAIQSLTLPDPNSPSIYAAIVGPCYMGKTQSAFTLAQLMTIFYVNFRSTLPTERRMQSIYAPFKRISFLIKECLRSDHSNAKLELSNTAKIYESQHAFKTLGFLYFLLRLEMPTQVSDQFLQYINLNNMVIPQLKVSEFKAKIRGKLGIN